MLSSNELNPVLEQPLKLPLKCLTWELEFFYRLKEPTLKNLSQFLFILFLFRRFPDELFIVSSLTSTQRCLVPSAFIDPLFS